MTEDVTTEWGRRLKGQRQAKRLSLREICELTGISKSYYCRLEQGLSEPRLEMRLKIAAALGVQVGEIFQYPELVGEG